MANQENKNTGTGYKNEGDRKAPGQNESKDSSLKADSSMKSGSNFNAGRGAKEEEDDEDVAGQGPTSRRESEEGEGMQKKAM